MTKIKAYLLNPANWVAFCVFIFGLGGVRASSNVRLSALEEKCHEVDTVKAQMYEIQASLAQIQTDINRIRAAIQK